MKLYQMQSIFLWTLAKLVLYSHTRGYEVTLGRGWETPESNKAVKGKEKSLHLIKLAQDLCLFKDGKYLTKSEDYKILGDWWKSQGLNFFWGGDFKERDGNHFSYGYGGMK